MTGYPGLKRRYSGFVGRQTELYDMKSYLFYRPFKNVLLVGHGKSYLAQEFTYLYLESKKLRHAVSCTISDLDKRAIEVEQQYGFKDVLFIVRGVMSTEEVIDKSKNFPELMFIFIFRMDDRMSLPEEIKSSQSKTTMKIKLRRYGEEITLSSLEKAFGEREDGVNSPYKKLHRFYKGMPVPLYQLLPILGNYEQIVHSENTNHDFLISACEKLSTLSTENSIPLTDAHDNLDESQEARCEEDGIRVNIHFITSFFYKDNPIIIEKLKKIFYICSWIHFEDIPVSFFRDSELQTAFEKLKYLRLLNTREDGSHRFLKMYQTTQKAIVKYLSINEPNDTSSICHQINEVIKIIRDSLQQVIHSALQQEEEKNTFKEELPLYLKHFKELKKHITNPDISKLDPSNMAPLFSIDCQSYFSALISIMNFYLFEVSELNLESGADKEISEEDPLLVECQSLLTFENARGCNYKERFNYNKRFYQAISNFQNLTVWSKYSVSGILKSIDRAAETHELSSESSNDNSPPFNFKSNGDQNFRR